ncbi:MAG: GNAT family N-acetyltransferase [Desulfovibrio sp.]|jgi:ribosomal-protein-alanine N-acetyltransferase|nr:GNAT family N-acetyltransferase [Desulfovibrio sp.]
MRPDENYSIVRLVRKDAQDLAALEAGCFSSGFSAGQYASILEAGEKAPFLVLGLFCPQGARGPALKAYVSFVLHRAGGEGEIYNIAARPDCRRRGYARALLSKVLDRARTEGLEKIFLETRAGNAPALGLYRSLGFTLCGKRKAYYADNGEDALILTWDNFAVNPKGRDT